jgi:hypothetical protein
LIEIKNIEAEIKEIEHVVFEIDGKRFLETFQENHLEPVYDLPKRRYCAWGKLYPFRRCCSNRNAAGIKEISATFSRKTATRKKTVRQ